MDPKRKIAVACYGYNVVYLLGAGLLFTLSSEFLPFHSDVIETPWNELEPAAQTLYLGMMRTEGAGFLASGVAIAVLLAIPYRRGAEWAPWAMALIGTVEHLPTLMANYHVATITNALPPWQAATFGIGTLLLGWILSVKSRSKITKD